MCVAVATLGLITSGISAGLGAVSAFGQYQQGKAQQEQSDANAKSVNEKAVSDNAAQARSDRYREGQEVVDMASSGVSGAYGSPFLVAIENAENSAINRGNSFLAQNNQANNIRTQGANAASQGRAGLLGGLANAAVTGYQGYQGYKRSTENALYLGGNTLPGVRRA